MPYSMSWGYDHPKLTKNTYCPSFHAIQFNETMSTNIAQKLADSKDNYTPDI